MPTSPSHFLTDAIRDEDEARPRTLPIVLGRCRRLRPLVEEGVGGPGIRTRELRPVSELVHGVRSRKDAGPRPMGHLSCESGSVGHEIVRPIAPNFRGGIPYFSESVLRTVSLGKEPMEPEVVVSRAAVLPVLADSVSQLHGERMVWLGGQEPAGQHAIRSWASESEEAGSRVVVDPPVERRDAEHGAVGPDATVLGQ